VTDEHQQLSRARELILNKQFDAARAILSDLPDNATAQQWLAKLDEIAPRVTHERPIQPLASDPPPAPAPPMVPPAQQTVSLTLNVTLTRYVVAGLVGVMGLLMIVGFFAFPWLDMTEISFFGLDLGAMASGFDVDKGPLEVTPMELWMGRNNGENFTLDVEKPQGGFADVRLVDRFLFLIPLGGLVLMWLAWVYAVDARVRRPVLLGMAAVAVFMLVWPFAWEDLSDRALKDSFNQSMQIDTSGADELGLDFSGFGEAMVTGIYSDAYSTGEQKLLGGLAVLACLVGLAVEFAPSWQAQPQRA
jgi:hypothetical protein